MHKFSSLLRSYLFPLEYSDRELALASDLPQHKVTLWMQNGPDIELTRKHISCLAVGIKLLYEQKGKSLPGELLLNRLLEAAGFSHVGRSRRTVRVGWCRVPFLAQDGGTDTDPRGFAIAITKDVAALAGWDLQWVRCESWQELIEAPLLGNVDIICPELLMLPSRLFNVRFSSIFPYPGFTVKVIVASSSLRDSVYIDQNRLLVNYIIAEVGEILVRELLPHAIVERGHSDITAAGKYLAKSDTCDGFHRCLIADELVCEQVRQENPGKFSFLELDKTPPLLNLAFASAIDDEILIPVLNDCIQMLDKSGYVNLRCAEAGLVV